MNFEECIEYVLQFEGGYVNDPTDPGGETNFGICKRDHPNVDIKNLTKEQAIEIYRTEYWEPNEPIFNAWHVVGSKGWAWQRDDLEKRIFDSLVNIGSKNTILILQRAMNVVGSRNIEEDGIFGPETRTSIISCDRANQQYPLLTTFQSERASYYRVLAAKNPNLEKFLDGWLKRAYS